MYSELMGITQEVANFLEGHRKAADETKCDILARVLRISSLGENAPKDFDLGQGATLRVGESMYLFLFEESKKKNKPDAVALVRRDGIYLDGKRVKPSKGSSIHPAMQVAQRRLGHRNHKGDLISLSAWRQWYVIRDGKFVRLLELKDPAKARTRGRDATNLTPDALGL